MDNRIIGLFMVQIILIAAISFALFIEGSSGSFASFFSVPSMVIVYGFGGGLTYMRVHLLKDGELGAELKQNLILAGWIGFMIGLVLLGVAMNGEGGQDHIGRGFAASLLTVLYGYISGNIAESFLAKKQILKK